MARMRNVTKADAKGLLNVEFKDSRGLDRWKLGVVALVLVINIVIFIGALVLAVVNIVDIVNNGANYWNVAWTIFAAILLIGSYKGARS